MKKYIFLIPILASLFSCNFLQKEKDQSTDKNTETPTIEASLIPKFNPDSAFYFLEKQVSFGNRIPNTPSHDACRDWFVATLNNYCDTVFVQKADLKAFDNKILKSSNIIGSINPTAKNRIIVAAHWDTRPFADQDTENKDKPIDGANDGGSGVAIILELARIFKEKDLKIGIDFILFDSEDYGQPSDSNFPAMEDSYCLGSQYWAKNPHIAGYRANWGILLDMCGAQNSIFSKEGTSMYYATSIVNRVWDNAAKLGYGSIFVSENSDNIIDDHLYVNKIANIPMIDIIHRTPQTPSGFGPYWHTHNDNIKVIDKNVLRAVGETVAYSLMEEDFNTK